MVIRQRPLPYWARPEPPQNVQRRIAIALAAVGTIAVASLALSIVELTRPQTPAAHTAVNSPGRAPLATTAATHELCTAIGPLQAESDQIANRWMALGPVGTPARVGGTAKFLSDIEASIVRVQHALDAHPAADGFLRRSLQRGLDDEHMIAADLRSGPFEPYDQNAWLDRQASYAGVLSECAKVGVRW
ncbi:hypothetical protein [Mycolicibacterium llatzerense]|uniref:hypothetical protein n=1 Tax=Mycolicibacterium llatzerense TaxID=280871 RepID=UPI0031DA1453